MLTPEGVLSTGRRKLFLGVAPYLSHPPCEIGVMINRRSFLSLVPGIGLAGFLRGAKALVKDTALLREPPEGGDWDWWRNLPRTPLACSDDPMTKSLCQTAALRQDVTILYDGGSQPGQSRRISPLGVFTVEGYRGTYVHAFCRLREAERTFRVDRIHALV